jgi:transposase InsO family protein
MQRMSERVFSTSSLSAVVGHPLIGLVLEEDGRRVVRYFADEAAADAAVADDALTRALAAIGSWSDLGWEETAEALDRIRHESEPTPPIER